MELVEDLGAKVNESGKRNEYINFFCKLIPMPLIV